MDEEKAPQQNRPITIRMTPQLRAMVRYLVDKEGYCDNSDAIRHLIRKEFTSKYSLQDLSQ